MNRGHNANQIRPCGVWDSIPGIDVERPNSEGGQMMLALLETQTPVWVARNGPSAELGLAIFEYIRDYAQLQHDDLLSARGLKTNFRVVASRITFFLDDLTNPAKPERRPLPNPLCRIRMDGSTSRTTLHLEFTKSEAAEMDTIFIAALDDVEHLELQLSQPDSLVRYDMLVPSFAGIDKDRLHRIMTLGFDAALINCLA
jgi:hypothetical protein